MAVSAMQRLKLYTTSLNLVTSVMFVKYSQSRQKRFAINQTIKLVECPLGTYGNDCKYNCGIACSVSNHCNKTTGECIGGCKPGWKIFFCNQSKICKMYHLKKQDLKQIKSI